MMVGLAEKSPLLGYEKSVQIMIEEIFIKKKMGSLKGADMSMLKDQLMLKYKGF